MSTAEASKIRSKPALLTLGWELLRIGALAFGGLGTTLALLQRVLVDRREWLHPDDITEGLAFTQALPGSTGIQLVAYLGWRLRAWPGALVAAIAFIAPATALMILAAAFSLSLPEHRAVNSALIGLQIGVVGLLAASMWRLSRSEARDAQRMAILLASAVLGFFIHAAMIVVGAGLIGALLYRESKNG